MFALVGFALVRALVPGGHRFCRHDAWRALVGTGLGVGVTSLAFLASFVIGTPQLAVEAMLLAVFAWFAWRGTECRFCSTAPRRPWDLLDCCLAAAFALAVGCAMAGFLRQTIASPHGHWDAWAIHNLHARFLSRSTIWRDLFTPLLTWSHPDYPLLVPGFIASWWKLLRSESTVVPAATAYLFTFGAAGLLASSVALLRDRRQGLLAGIVVLSAPSFIEIGALQFVDVPVAWFLLAATVLLATDNAAAAGLAAGFCAWTKNDGVMLCLALVVGWGLALQWRVPRLRRFGLGAMVPLAVLVWFKLTVAPPNPLVSTDNALQHLTDMSRYATILGSFAWHAWTFGGLVVSPFLLLLAYAGLMFAGTRQGPAVRAVAVTLVVAACGDAAVYMFATHTPLAQLIDSSLDRLLVQLWPTAVFLVFLAARPIERVGLASESAVTLPQIVPAPPAGFRLPSYSLLLLSVLLLSSLLLYVNLRPRARSGYMAAMVGPAHEQTAPVPLSEILYHIEVVGPVINPHGKIVMAFASRDLVVAGWAVDGPNRLPASRVDIVVDDVAYPARYGIVRADVAAYLKDNVYERSGFEGSVTAGKLTAGRHVVAIRVVGSDGKSSTQSSGITVVLE